MTDNGLVFTTRLAGGKGGRNALEAELRRLASPRRTASRTTPDPGQSRAIPADPEELAPRPAATSPPPSRELQALLDAFTALYNTRRPHRSLPHRATPATAYNARPKAVPGDRTADTHDRVRTDRVDADGKLTLRVGGRLHHIGIGRTHARTPVLMLVQDLHVRVITPPPASSSASSPSTPPGTTSPPASHPAAPRKPRPPRKQKTPNPMRVRVIPMS